MLQIRRNTRKVVCRSKALNPNVPRIGLRMSSTVWGYLPHMTALTKFGTIGGRIIYFRVINFSSVRVSLHLLARRFGAGKTRKTCRKHGCWTGYFYFCKRSAQMVVISSGYTWLRDITLLKRSFFWRMPICPGSDRSNTLAMFCSFAY